MEFSAEQIAEFLQGKVEGNKKVIVNKVCKIEEGEQGAISFLANIKYVPFIYETKASIVIINNEFILERKTNATLIRVKDAYSSFASLLKLYNRYRFNRTGISSLAFINDSVTLQENCYIGEYSVLDKGVKVGKNTRIYPQVYIGDNTIIGDNVIIYPGVKIYHDVVIGDNCIIHSGAVIGADGFGFAPLDDGSLKKIEQIGNVIIEENVEIGANTCVDRSTIGSTVIHRGVKIDNLCQIAHNVSVGNSTVMSAQTGLAGSTQLGKNCFVGGQVGFAGHIKIGDRVQVGAQSGVMTDVQDDAQLLGSPAFPPKEWMRSYVCFKRLPDLEKKVRELENKLRTKADN